MQNKKHNTNINLSPDPTPGAVTDTDTILTNDLDAVNPEQPLVPKNEYDMVVKKIEQTRSEKSGNNMVAIQLGMLNPVTTVTGETIPAGGLTFFSRIVITPTEKMTKESIQRAMKKFQLACGIKSGPMHPLSQFEGKTCRVSIGFAKKTDDYPDDRNEVKGFVVPK